MYLYYRNNGDVVMRSEEKLDTQLNELEIIPTKEQQQKIDENQIMKLINNQLEFKEHDHIKRLKTVESLKSEVDKATSIDELKLIIKDLIK